MPRGRRNPATFDTELADSPETLASWRQEHGAAADFSMLLIMVCWILLLEHGLRRTVSPFAARKLCHAGCGLGIMLMDSSDLRARLIIWAVALGSIGITWNLSPLPTFRFARPRDPGVTAYLLLVSVWFYLQLPAPILAPVFFADPAGAIVGKLCSQHLPDWNRRWHGEKTVFGSAAVFIVTFGTVAFPCTLLQRTVIAAAATLAEGFGGDFDNLALAGVVVVGWLAVQK